MRFAGTLDGTSDKNEFFIAPYTVDGPASPHDPTPAPGGTAAHTSIRFPGKGLVDYGEMVCTALLNILENFAAERPPEYPTSGQLWYDLTTGYMRVWDETVWQPTQVQVSATDPVPAVPPTSPSIYVPLPTGTLWYNTTTNMLCQRQGSAWVEVTGNYVQKSGDTMTGNLDMGGTHTITGIATPSNSTDAVNKGYFDSHTASFVSSTYMWPIANVINLQPALDDITADVQSLQVEVASNTSITNALQADMDDKLSASNGIITGTVDVQGLLSVNATGHLRINSPISVPTDAATKGYVDTAIAGVSGGGGSTVAGLDDLTDVIIGTIQPNDLIGYSLLDGAWTNQQPVDLGLAPLSHTTQVSGAHAASSISFSPPVGMVSTDVQAAVESVFATKLGLAGGQMTGALYLGNNILSGIPLPVNPTDAVSKTYIDKVTANPRRITTVSSATSATTPMVKSGQNNLTVFLNGVKQYQSSTASQVVNVNHVISDTTVITGIPNDDTVYTANVTSTTNHQIIDKQGNSFAIPGNHIGWYLPGTAFTVADSTGNNGAYTVAAGGSTYNATTRVTTIPTTTTPPSGVVDGVVVITAKTRPIAIRGRLMQTYSGLLSRLMSVREVIESASNAGSSVRIYGDYTTIFTAGVVFTMTGTTVNDGDYTVVSSSFASGKTTIITTVAPADAVDLGLILTNAVSEFSVDIGDYNIRLVGSGVGGSTTSISIVDTGAHHLMSSLTDYVSIQAAVPGFTGSYIEDMRYRFRNKDDATVVDTLLFSPAITGVLEIIAATPSL